jgi:vancomycin resistance protein YoaR
MEDDIVFKEYKGRKRKMIISGLLSISIILSVYIFSVAFGVLLSGKINNGISISGIKVGGYTKEEAKKLLAKKYLDNINTKQLIIEAGLQSEKIDFAKAKVSYDLDKSLDEAYNYSRQGSLVKKIIRQSMFILEVSNIDISFSYDEKYISDILEQLSKKVYISPKEYNIEIQSPDKVILKTGHKGKRLNKEDAISKIENAIRSVNTSNIKLIIEDIMPQNIELEDVVKKIDSDPIDAKTKVIENRIEIIPEVYGRISERKELVDAISSVQGNEDSEVIIPVKFIPAKMKVSDVEPLLLKDELVTFHTLFYTTDVNSINRKHNIKKAASIINGKILGVNDVFSFNETVGARTLEKGYKSAHSYVLGKIIDSAGGGICQVSTTLYNAVLLADLQIVERRNHLYTVDYIPLGRDAAVSYNDCDFKFKNNTGFPIKIISWVSDDNKMYFSLIGTKEHPTKSQDFRYEFVSEIAPHDVISYDSSKPKGSRVVKQEGMKGYVVKAWKTIKEDGKPYSEVFLGLSEYLPLPRQIVIGTGKP